MPSSEHAIQGSDGEYCCNCSSAVGAPVKVQPTTVDGEVFCPRCFCWSRAALEPDRFNSSQTAAVKCQFCQWTTVCMGARPGMGLICSHCRRGGCIRVPMTRDDAAAVKKAIEG